MNVRVATSMNLVSPALDLGTAQARPAYDSFGSEQLSENEDPHGKA